MGFWRAGGPPEWEEEEKEVKGGGRGREGEGGSRFCRCLPGGVRCTQSRTCVWIAGPEAEADQPPTYKQLDGDHDPEKVEYV